MNKTILFGILLAGVLAFQSCDDKKEIDGPQGDTIKFSTTQVAFDIRGGSQTVTSQGDGWWITGLEVDGEQYLRDSLAKMEIIWGVPKKWEGGLTWDEAQVDSLKSNVEVKQVSQGWVTFDRDERRKVIVQAEENTTEKPRTAVLEVQDCNYFSRITVTQQAWK